jgi:hypothetical protein
MQIYYDISPKCVILNKSLSIEIIVNLPVENMIFFPKSKKTGHFSPQKGLGRLPQN